jgi:hypothetical protein
MNKWRYVGEWSDDDPAIRRLRDALALRLVDAGVAAASTEDAGASLDPATRRERIAGLVYRLKDGDLSTVEPLRRLLPGEGDYRA